MLGSTQGRVLPGGTGASHAMLRRCGRHLHKGGVSPSLSQPCAAEGATADLTSLLMAGAARVPIKTYNECSFSIRSTSSSPTDQDRIPAGILLTWSGGAQHELLHLTVVAVLWPRLSLPASYWRVPLACHAVRGSDARTSILRAASHIMHFISTDRRQRSHRT